MNNSHAPVVFVWPGDLHLETADRENHRVAEWMVDQVNTLVRPDFVQWAGDNVQHATEAQFELFGKLCSRLSVPNFPLVGDHDAHHDPKASAYKSYCGETYGAMSMNGYRFIRLNTMEFKPLGISEEQIAWFKYQLDIAKARAERVVLFQHHYPFQIMEDFAGPGIDEWRALVMSRPITAIFAGHTHYGQIANDGHNITIATRSIGDPEGGPAGFSVVYLHGDDLAVTYRSIEDKGPIVLVTHPRDALLATDGRHIISGLNECRVRTWSNSPITSVTMRLASGSPVDMTSSRPNEWSGPLPGDRLPKGETQLTVEATDADGIVGRSQINIIVDRSGRYTAYPRVSPEVTSTRFC